jgi:hypothetical protein
VAYATGRAGGHHDAHDLPLLVGQTARLVLWQTPAVAVAAAALWLLISDPVTAAAVMERGDLLPVLAALMKIIGKALMSVLSAL